MWQARQRWMRMAEVFARCGGLEQFRHHQTGKSDPPGRQAS
jgi:hypothetical protein